MTTHSANPTTTTVKDPVCGMNIDPAKAFAQQPFGGADYYFCSQHCLDKFVADPTKYVTSASQYTCPMHPEVVESGPGKCPKCGMALEPRSAAA